MASSSVIASDTPPYKPNEPTTREAVYGARGAATAQRSQELAEALAAMRDQANDIGAPADPDAALLADALMRSFGPSAQDFAEAARVDQPWRVAPALFGPGQPGGGQPVASAPAITPDRLKRSFGGAGMHPAFDDLIPAWQAGLPQDETVDFDDLIPNQLAPWRPSPSGAGPDRQPPPAQGDLPPISQKDIADLEGKGGLNLNVAPDPNSPGLNGPTDSPPGSPTSDLPDTSTTPGAAANSGLDGVTINPGALPGMMFAQYFVQPDETAYGGPLESPTPSELSGEASPLLPKGAVVLQPQLDLSPGARATMIKPVYRYDHTFDSLTEIHPDLTASSIDTPGGTMHIWNTNGANIATLDSREYDASTQLGFINRAYYDAHTGQYLGTYRVANDGVPFQLPNGTVVQYDPAPTPLDKLSSAWSDSWFGQATRETWDDIAGGALGGEGELLESAAAAASRLPAAVRFLLTGGAEEGGALAALRADRLAEANQLAALEPTGRAAIAPPQGGAKFGTALSNDYRATFFKAYPELEGQVVVHHAIPRRTLTLYPEEVTASEIHSLENLRGIPNELNSDVHLSQIAREWSQFYKANPNATRGQLLRKATDIDIKYGKLFKPAVSGDL